MNKTVTINISGIIFHIEEDAFDKLNAYLNTIKGYFTNTEGGSEIMADIEARIAELLQSATSVSKQVIVIDDVAQVIAVMGKPEEFGSEQENEAQNQSQDNINYSREKIKRRLFRNPDDKAIGGVCSGLAAYFDIDTVWVRLAMFLLFFFGGLSLWVYVVLWIVMPEAKTTADKFAMRGESANINNIFKSFKDEAEDVKTRFNKYGKEFRDKNYGAAVRSNAAVVMGTIFDILGRLIGLFMIVIGGIFLFAYVAGLTGISFLDGNTDLIHWRSVIFESPTDYALGIFSIIVVIGIPVLTLVYTGVKLLFRIHYSNRWLNMSLGILWTIGLIVGIYVTATTAKQFNESARLKETFQLHGMGDTIVIKLNPAVNVLSRYNYDNTDDIESAISRDHDGYYFGEQNRQLSILGYAGLNVVESPSDSVELTVSRVSRGFDKRDANENAKSIQYAYLQNQNVLSFDEIFSVGEGNKFRIQEVNLKLKVPRGTVVYFDRSVKYLLDDIENTTNTWDGNMIDRRWKMTGRGLKCIDCDNLDSMDEDDETHIYIHDKDKVTINEKGIHVSGKDAEIKIDKDGIKIKTPEKDVILGNKKKKTKKSQEEEEVIEE